MTSSQPLQIKITDDKTFTEGDCTIISSDNIRFRIPSYYILSSSETLRKIYNSHPKASKSFEIDMSDSDTETATAIHSWLNATQWRMPGVDNQLIDKSLPIMHLAKKYGCAPMRAAIMKLVEEAIDKAIDIPVEQIMIFGAIFDESQLVAKVIRSSGMSKVSEESVIPGARKRDYDSYADDPLEANHRRILTRPGYSFPSNQSVRRSLPVHSVPIPPTLCASIDPKTWSIKDWRRTPLDYLWALTQACLHETTAVGRAKRFLEIIVLNPTEGPGSSSSTSTSRKGKAPVVEK